MSTARTASQFPLQHEAFLQPTPTFAGNLPVRSIQHTAPANCIDFSPTSHPFLDAFEVLQKPMGCKNPACWAVLITGTKKCLSGVLLSVPLQAKLQEKNKQLLDSQASSLLGLFNRVSKKPKVRTNKHQFSWDRITREVVPGM